jgi:hypothetical protein
MAGQTRRAGKISRKVFGGVARVPHRADPDRAASRDCRLLLRRGLLIQKLEKRVGPPDAIKTGGPVPRHYNTGREGRFAGQCDATGTTLATRARTENENAVLT